VFQLVADVCARYAGDSSKFISLFVLILTPDITVEVIVRAFFCLIQTVMLLLYEGGVSPVQLRVLLLLWANSFVKACSVESNPIETLLVLSVALWSLFDSMDDEMKENTKMRAQEIVSSFELPVSRASEFKGQKLKIKPTHYVPDLLTSLLSTVFMVYLLSRRH